MVARKGAAGGSSKIGVILLAAVVVLLLGGGGAAAFAVPIKTVTPDRSVAEMLPRSTAFYAAVDLNPDGQTKADLAALSADFTRQTNWKHLSAAFDQAKNTSSSTSDCLNKTEQQASDILSQLGHQAAFALINPRGVNLSSLNGANAGSKASEALTRMVVGLIPLHRQLTLAQALRGAQFSLPEKATEYDGTSIYRATIASCQKASSVAPQAFYGALFHGYIVLGLKPDSIERVIDTVNGKLPSLATAPVYRRLMAQLPGNALGSYYLDGQALLSKDGLLNGVRDLAGSTSLDTSSYANAYRPAAGALTVDAGGFRLVTASLTGSAPNATSAGAAASLLPGDTLAFVSVQGLDKAIRSNVDQLESSGVLTGSDKARIDNIVNDLTVDMTGETDLVLFNPAGRMSLSGSSTSSIPLAVMWQIGDESSARQHLDDLVDQQLDQGNEFTALSGPDGTTYEVNSGGYGYGVYKGWAIASLSMTNTLSILSSPPAAPLSSTPPYHAIVTAGGKPTSTWYVEVHGLRQALESSLVSSLPSSEVTQYNEDVLPLLAPIRSIAGTAGSNRNSVAVSTLRVDIGPATETVARS